jgi:hypothetical protein
VYTRRTDRRALAIVFFSAFVMCALVCKSHVFGWNDGSRVATVDALTASHTFVIDGSPFERGLGDEIRFHGHTYSDKQPLLPLLAAAVMFAVAPLGITLRQTPGTAIYLLTLFTVGLWFAVGCCYAFQFQRLLGFDRKVAGAVAALTGLGTLALPYAAVFANHVPCGAAALAGCYHLVRARRGGRFDAALGGLFFSIAYAFDAASALFAVTALVLLWGGSLRSALLCGAAALPVVVLQAAFNAAISGSVIPAAYNAAVWSGSGPSPQGIGASQMLHAHSPGLYVRFLVNELVGEKGLFSFTPLAALAGYGLVAMWRAPAEMRRIALAVAATVAVFVFAIVFLSDDTATANFGERRYVDVFFVLCVALGPALAAVRSALGAFVARLLMASSIAIATLGTVNPFAGSAGEWGVLRGAAEFGALAHRAHVQAALDLVLVAGLIAAVVRLTPLGTAAAASAAPRRT